MRLESPALVLLITLLSSGAKASRLDPLVADALVEVAEAEDVDGAVVEELELCVVD